ncbi:iron complex outermembrane recepter protein [Sphingomonas laterariae]|uniref:Iron complex outermembrane recepter protein n=1 Tax=Edaphosphingomonas laterariae TaxID=861865 RepID=A0A239J275_9SPHN|nr:TonB-dependent receptor [Sphingomonas laterariae]SNT00126.1 iron complex outermembrane recepter protein [Sphingomonas laterariae]
MAIPAAAQEQPPAPAPAPAAERTARTAVDTGDTIVVTARRRTERAQDVPIALTALNDEQVAVPGTMGLTQVAQLAPSLQITATNARQTNINIRGLGATPAFASLGVEYGVGIYVDQVYYSRPTQAAFDLYDLERLEVLRGPQGTLFGKNTTAGAINITTRAPSFDPEVRGELSIGNYQLTQLRASGSAPITDTLAVRVSVTDTIRDKGFSVNVRDGSRKNDLRSFSVRGQLLFKPTDNFSLRLIADHSDLQQDCCIGSMTTVRQTRLDGSAVPNDFYARAARFGYTPLPIDPFARKLDLNRPLGLKVKTDGISGIADLDLGSATITSVTAWRSLSYTPEIDADTIGLDIFTDAGIYEKQEQFSQELRIASNDGDTIDYVAGLYYFSQRIDDKIFTKYGPDAALWIIGPAMGSTQASAGAQAALNGLFVDGTARADTKSYAAFGQLIWHIAEGFDLTGGLRYTYEKKDGFFEQVQRGPTLTPGQIAMGAQAIRNAFGRDIPRYTAKTSEDNISGLLTLSYKFTPDVMAYGTYSRGYKSGGLNLNATGAPPTIAPEKVDNFEVGIKSTLLDRRLTLNLSAFSTEIHNYQSQQIDTAVALTAYIANVGTVRSRGLEADATLRLVPGLSLFASGSYIDATYRNFENAPCPIEYSVPVCDLSGRSLPGVSKYSAAAGGEYAVGLDTDSEAYFNLNYSYRSKFNATYNLAADAVVDGYGLTNIALGVRSPDGNWDASIFARNLFDTKYFNTIGPGAFNTGQYSGGTGDPRTYGITLRTKI